MLSNKQKQAALRKRRAAQGLKELRGVYVPALLEKQIKKVINEMVNNYERPE